MDNSGTYAMAAYEEFMGPSTPQLPVVGGAKDFLLYGGHVKMVFNPDSPRYRYRITDTANKRLDQPMRGVTTVLRDVIAKPDLLLWPLNEANKALFGAKWDEALKQSFYDPEGALLKPETAYSPGQLQEFMELGLKAHTKKGDRGKDIGTMGHRVLEVMLWGYRYGVDVSPFEVVVEESKPNEEDTKTLKKISASLTKWWTALLREHEVEVLELERPVYSRKMNYCGTLDLVLGIDGKVVLIDLKTTNRSRKAPLGIYAEYFVQLGAYSYALREETGYSIDDVGVLNVGKDGVINAALASDLSLTVDECERAFGFALRTHDWLERANRALVYNPNSISLLNPLAKVEKPAAKK